MSVSFVHRCLAWLDACIPARLRENKMQSFVATCVMVSATLWVCTLLAPFGEAMATGGMAVTLMLAVLAVYLGVSLQTCIQWVLCVTLLALAYAVWGLGGILSNLS